MSDQSKGTVPLAQPLALGAMVEGWVVKAVLGLNADGFSYQVESEKDGRERVLCEFFPAGSALRLGTVVVPTLRARNEFALAMQAFIDKAQRDRQAAHPAYPLLSDVIRANGSAYVVSLQHEGQPLRVNLSPLPQENRSEETGVASAAAIPSLAAVGSTPAPPWSHAHSDQEFMQTLTACVQSVAQAVPNPPQAEWPNRVPAKPSLVRPRQVTTATMPRHHAALVTEPANAKPVSAKTLAPAQPRLATLPIALAAAAVMSLIASVWMTQQVMSSDSSLAVRNTAPPQATEAAHAPPVVVAFRAAAPAVPVASTAPPALALAPANLDMVPAPAAGRPDRAQRTKPATQVPAAAARSALVAHAAAPNDRGCSDWLVRQSLGMPHPGGTEAQTAAGCRQ